MSRSPPRRLRVTKAFQETILSMHQRLSQLRVGLTALRDDASRLPSTVSSYLHKIDRVSFGEAGTNEVIQSQDVMSKFERILIASDSHLTSDLSFRNALHGIQQKLRNVPHNTNSQVSSFYRHLLQDIQLLDGLLANKGLRQRTLYEVQCLRRSAVENMMVYGKAAVRDAADLSSIMIEESQRQKLVLGEPLNEEEMELLREIKEHGALLTHHQGLEVEGSDVDAGELRSSLEVCQQLLSGWKEHNILASFGADVSPEIAPLSLTHPSQADSVVERMLKVVRCFPRGTASMTEVREIQSLGSLWLELCGNFQIKLLQQQYAKLLEAVSNLRRITSLRSKLMQESFSSIVTLYEELTARGKPLTFEQPKDRQPMSASLITEKRESYQHQNLLQFTKRPNRTLFQSIELEQRLRTAQHRLRPEPIRPLKATKPVIISEMQAMEDRVAPRPSSALDRALLQNKGCQTENILDGQSLRSTTQHFIECANDILGLPKASGQDPKASLGVVLQKVLQLKQEHDVDLRPHTVQNPAESSYPYIPQAARIKPMTMASRSKLHSAGMHLDISSVSGKLLKDSALSASVGSPFRVSHSRKKSYK